MRLVPIALLAVLLSGCGSRVEHSSTLRPVEADDRARPIADFNVWHDSLFAIGDPVVVGLQGKDQAGDEGISQFNVGDHLQPQLDEVPGELLLILPAKEGGSSTTIGRMRFDRDQNIRLCSEAESLNCRAWVTSKAGVPSALRIEILSGGLLLDVLEFDALPKLDPGQVLDFSRFRAFYQPTPGLESLASIWLVPAPAATLVTPTTIGMGAELVGMAPIKLRFGGQEVAIGTSDGTYVSICEAAYAHTCRISIVLSGGTSKGRRDVDHLAIDLFDGDRMFGSVAFTPVREDGI